MGWPPVYIYTMNNATDTEIYDMDGVCICKLEGCSFCNPDHRCAGDNCYCIGGDENFDLDTNFEPW